jgi:hypothetical protein
MDMAVVEGMISIMAVRGTFTAQFVCVHELRSLIAIVDLMKTPLCVPCCLLLFVQPSETTLSAIFFDMYF